MIQQEKFLSVQRTPMRKESTLEIDLSNIKYIKKDINMIVLPFFYFSHKNKYGIIKYNFDNDKSKQMIVKASQDSYVPSSFDYEVTLVLLKLYEFHSQKTPEADGFWCSVRDIARGLNKIYTSNKCRGGISMADKQRIIEGINKLRETNYILVNLYNVKEINEKGEKIYSKKESVTINILASLGVEEDLFKQDARFFIKFSPLFLNSIKNKYHFLYDVSRLDSIHKTSAKRLFEIIDFQRNRKKEEKFNYNEIAWAIPLNSQRKNRILINEYLVHLKDVGVIKNFIPDSPKGFFQVFFIDEVLREDFLKEMPLKAILPKTTQIELFGSKPKKRVFSEEEQILLDKYVAIKNDQGKIENIPGYRYKIEENISSDESILDSIRQFVEAHEKAELVKKEKAQILTEKEKQVEQEKQNFEEQKKEHDELLQRMNSLPEKELMAIQTAAIEKLKREFPDLDLEDEKGFNQKLISAEMLEIYKNLVMAM